MNNNVSYQLFLNADIKLMRGKYAGDAMAWSDEEVYAHYTTYYGQAPKR